MQTSDFVETLLIGWEKNADYAQRLVADLSEAQMVAQPAPGTNHPAWTFSHLSAYHPTVVALLRGQPADDPLTHEFGMKSKPETNRTVYPMKEDLIQNFLDGHEAVMEALQAADEAILAARPCLSSVGNRAFPVSHRVLAI